MTDTIGDLLSRIKNAYRAKLPRIELPLSKMKLGIARVLEKEGYVKKVDTLEKDGHNFLVIELEYKDNLPVLTDIKQVSKPGIRIYSKVGKIPRVWGKWGFSILSTPKGIMSDKQAKKENVGGELICRVW